MSSRHAPSPTAEAQAPAAEASQRAYFFVSGIAGPDLMPRLLSPFIKLGLMPYRVHASSENGTGEEMAVELRFAGLAPDIAEGLAARCRAVIGVRSVLTVTE
jgi:hypothetical protein